MARLHIIVHLVHVGPSERALICIRALTSMENVDESWAYGLIAYSGE